jgi:hypothetical protein
LISRAAAALRQASHFVRHDSKAAALFPGPGGFHCRIQRQDIGLIGDATNGADDVANLA